MPLFWVFILCVLPRLAYLCFDKAAPMLEASVYWDISENILRSGVLDFWDNSTTRVEPLYPIFLALCRFLAFNNLFIVLSLQIALCSAACIVFYKLCELLSNRRTAAIAVFLFSFYPYLVRQQVSLIEVSLVTSLLIAGAYFYCRPLGLRSSFYCGAAFGFALLTRAALLPVWLLGLSTVFLKKNFKSGMVMVFVSALIVFPFFLRNYLSDGSFLTSRMGYDLYKGNNAYSDSLIPTYSLDVLTPQLFEELEKESPDLLNADENKIDRYFFGKAVQFMYQNKMKTMKLKLKNVFYFFHPRIVPFHPFEPNSKLVITEKGEAHVEGSAVRDPLAERVHSIFYGFILFAAGTGIFLRRKEFQKDAILYFILIGFTLVHCVYWPATRYRVSMDFVLIFFAAYAVDRILRKMTR